MKITITLDTDRAAFLNADELENLLQRVGERITNGQYWAKNTPIIHNFHTCGNVRIEEKES